MLNNTVVRTAGNLGFDDINTDVRLEAPLECFPIYPFRFWCLPDKDKDKGDEPLDDGDLKIDTRTDVGLDVYTNELSAENPGLIPDVP